MSTSIDAIIEHLIENPDDHDARWRLCKKLYAKREYEDVLPHLEQLKEDWKPKRNVDRYLAATYYRLKLYGQSIALLEDAVDRWPEETGLREQLARVYEVSGDREAAAREWEVMYRLDPTRSSASNAIERLRDPDGKVEVLPEAADVGEVVIVCPNCGAKNSPDFEVCWKCQALLTMSPTPTPIEFLSSEDLVPPSTSRLLLSGLLSVAVLAGAVYVTLRYVVPPLVFGTAGAAGSNLEDGINLNLAIPRAIAGVVALIVSPICLWLGTKMVRAKKLPPGQPWTIGIFVAGVLYLGQWAPLPQLVFSIGAALAVAFLAPLYSLQIRMLPRIGITLVSFILTVAAAGSAFVALAGIEPFVNIGAMEVIQASALAQAGKSPRKATTPYIIEHRFTSTGSPWVDKTAGVVRFDVEATADSANLQIEYRDASDAIVARTTLSGKSTSIGARVQPNTAYRLVIQSNQRYDVVVRPMSPLHIVYEP